MPSAPKNRYHSLSIMLHWSIALGLLFMFASGLYMVYADISKADQYKLFQIHKAAGVIMLWAILLRVGVKIFIKAPAEPTEFNQNDIQKAKLGHIGLYCVLVVMPLSGWVMVSASPFGLPTFVFVDWIKWPHIPGIARNKTVETVANYTHWINAIVMSVLVVGHIAAVIWHKRRHRVNLLSRMWWTANTEAKKQGKNSNE
ncbi:MULTISPECIES: cytochrome b [Alteromonadaceae]|uniref:Cytochrome b n=1 Tax=Brumicola blandensis TaxID=3075611 RepID=A0AAW8QZG2_9ALTE|nr:MULTISPECIES: cytochrome b [unclassified Alteromonas]MDT0582461.1 cytochrome b [Alteromonas sp. W409]MDT0628684.1 cytochrome b [Alteromonas sp. W364]